MKLTIIEESDRISRVALSGRLDLEGVMSVESEFITHVSARKKPAVIDLSGVEFIASLGVRMILSAAKQLKRYDASIALLKPRPMVADVLDSIGLEDILHVTDSEEAAMNYALKPE